MAAAPSISSSDKSHGDVQPAIAGAAKKLSATYEYPFLKHAPIGPTMALADIRSEGTVHIYMHYQNPQAHPIRQFLRPVIRKVLRQRLLESHIRSKRNTHTTTAFEISTGAMILPGSSGAKIRRHRHYMSEPSDARQENPTGSIMT
jgi:Molybdopterin-binding domain of aldehyde dehydrogenase